MQTKEALRYHFISYYLTKIRKLDALIVGRNKENSTIYIFSGGILTCRPIVCLQILNNQLCRKEKYIAFIYIQVYIYIVYMFLYIHYIQFTMNFINIQAYSIQLIIINNIYCNFHLELIYFHRMLLLIFAKVFSCGCNPRRSADLI